MKWNKITFDLLLEQDVIISASSATAGQHLALDYIPGSSLLGMAAAKLYRDLSAEEAWLVFHSGRLRFGDAVPAAVNNAPAYPVPLALHSYKGEKYTYRRAGLEYLDSERLFNLVMSPALKADRQPKQLRRGYLSGCGEYIQPLFNQRMKTAIDAQTGRAAQAQLFGYQSLAAGQQYAFSLVVDADLDPLLVERVCNAMLGRSVLGRSRSAQYGGVSIAAAGREDEPVATAQQHEQLALWLLSDLALVDGNGCTTLQPDAAMLGLPAAARWLPQKSFIRSRSYNSYNAWRRCYDPERQVISRGSVLVFDLPAAAELPKEMWCGLYQEAGLGHISVNSPLLGEECPQFQAPVELVVSESVPDKPCSELICLLDRVVGREIDGSQAQQLSERIMGVLLDALLQARTWLALSEAEPLVAPARSQWGRIKALANDCREQPEKLWAAIFDSEQALVNLRQGQPGWKLEVNPQTSLADVLRNQLAEYREDSRLPDIIGRLAVLGMASDWQSAVEGLPNNNTVNGSGK